MDEVTGLFKTEEQSSTKHHDKGQVDDFAGGGGVPVPPSLTEEGGKRHAKRRSIQVPIDEVATGVRIKDDKGHEFELVPVRAAKKKKKTVKKCIGWYQSIQRNVAVFKREQYHWRWVKLMQVLCVIYIVIYTFGGFEGATVRQPGIGIIIDPASPERTDEGIILSNGAERSIVAANNFQLFCLSIARISAFYMYPTLILVYVSKLRATINFIAQSPLSMFLMDDWHDLHIYCGWSVFVNSVVHTLFHIMRYADQGNLSLLVTNRSGLSGVIIFVALLLICPPMITTRLKNFLNYEIRKAFHYFLIVFAVALVFHAPVSALPNGGFCPIVFGVLISWYFLDFLYCSTFMSEKIDTTIFDVLPSGVQMTLEVSERYNTHFTGGYCYICLPWVDKTQWHAFSLFEHPTNPDLKQVFMLKNGDWTRKVHEYLARDTVRPVWIQGPFLSPYNRSVDYDNQIMVASGIGITPALSVLRAQKDSRRTNLIWCVRDPALLEFFLERAYLDHSGWNLFFYTGKKKLVSARIDQLTSTNVQVIKGRPNLPMVIRNIIYGIESGIGCPDSYIPDQKQIVTNALLGTLEELDRRGSVTCQEKVSILADTATEYGFQLTNTLYDLGGLFDESFTSRGGRTRLDDTHHTEQSETKVETPSPTHSRAGSETSWDEEKVLGKLYELAGGVTERGALYIAPGASSERQNSYELGNPSGRISTISERISSRISSPKNPGLRNRHTRRLRRNTQAITIRSLSNALHSGGRRGSTFPLPSALGAGSMHRGSTIPNTLGSGSRHRGSTIPNTLGSRSMHRGSTISGRQPPPLTTVPSESLVGESLHGRDSFVGSTHRGSTVSFRQPPTLETVPSDDLEGESLHSRDSFIGSGPTHHRGSTISFRQPPTLETVPSESLVGGSLHSRDSFLGSRSSHRESFALLQASRDAMLEEAMEIGFKPWEEDDEALYFVKSMDEKLLATWGLLYCGGSKVIEDQLKLAANEYGIELHTESFSW